MANRHFINTENDALVSETELLKLYEDSKAENGLYSDSFNKWLYACMKENDGSLVRAFKDTESGEIVSEETIREEWKADHCEHETFKEYLDCCLSKNGFLKEITSEEIAEIVNNSEDFDGLYFYKMEYYKEFTDGHEVLKADDFNSKDKWFYISGIKIKSTSDPAKVLADKWFCICR